MRVYVQGNFERQESKYLWHKIAERIASSGNHHIVNSCEDGLETSLSKAQQADAIVAELGGYDDATWAVIGMAVAGNRPIVPFWVGSHAPENFYGFTADVERRNRHLIRRNGESTPWPSTSIQGLKADVDRLEQNSDWRFQRIPKPGKESVDLSKPAYIVGDSRQWWDQFAFYCIEAAFGANRIPTINPSKVLDDYTIANFPDRIEVDPEKDNDEQCFLNAGERSSMMVSRGVSVRNLLGARVEEGAAWFASHPIFYLDSYVFPSKGTVSEKFSQGKNPGMHLQDVFEQNRDLWQVQQHDFRTPAGIAKEICRIRGVEYREPERDEVLVAFHNLHTQLNHFAQRYSRE